MEKLVRVEKGDEVEERAKRHERCGGGKGKRKRKSEREKRVKGERVNK